MNERLKTTLLARLQQAIESWIDTFEDDRLEGVNDDSRRKHLSGTAGLGEGPGSFAEKTCARNLNAKPSHSPGPASGVRSSQLVFPTPRLAWSRV